MPTKSPTRIRPLTQASPNPHGTYVLYWMIAQRRTRYNYALQHAHQLAQAHGVPLLVFEPLRAGYPWASVRIHRFVIQGMTDNAQRCQAAGVSYLPYVEPAPGEGKGLLAALATQAVAVVTDDWPAFFVPAMLASAATQLSVPLVAVDGVGMIPFGHHEREFTVAHSFRRHLQKTLRPHLSAVPVANPLAGYDLGPAPVHPNVATRWGLAAPQAMLKRPLPTGLDPLPESPVVGGSIAAEAALDRFIRGRLSNYLERNHPDQRAASGLSPYLHFGHLSAHQVVARVWASEDWSVSQLAPKANGKRHGWWGLSKPAEAFLDELITWRELGFAWCAANPGREGHYDALPQWALATLADHAGDPRPYHYNLDTLAKAQTHDPIWNAAQRQLAEHGVMHNYLRMLWGKHVLAWSETPKIAFETLIELNNRYALDGRDPNSYSGIGWVFGRFDRAWGPERPIFGKVRYMTSASTARKLTMTDYLAQWGEGPGATHPQLGLVPHR